MHTVTRIQGNEITDGTVLYFEAFWDVPEHTATITNIGEWEKAFDAMHEKWIRRAPVTMVFDDGEKAPWHIIDEMLYYRVLS